MAVIRVGSVILVRIVLATAFLALAATKVVSGYPEKVWLAPAAYWAITALEATLGACLLLALRPAAAAVASLFWASAATAFTLFVPTRNCGCLGSWAISDQSRILLACGMGALSCIVVGCRPGGVSPCPN